MKSLAGAGGCLLGAVGDSALGSEVGSASGLLGGGGFSRSSELLLPLRAFPSLLAEGDDSTVGPIPLAFPTLSSLALSVGRSSMAARGNDRGAGAIGLTDSV